MKKFYITGVVLFSTLLCFSQSFKAKLKIGSKDNIDVLSCDYPAPSDANGTQNFTTTNGNKYSITIKNKAVVGHKVLTATGKKVTLMPVTGSNAGVKTCQSCINITWPDGRTEDLCDNISCTDFKVLSKSVTPQ